MKETISVFRRLMYIPEIKIFVTSFLSYHQDIANLSGYFGDAWADPSKKIVSGFWKLLMSINKQKINFIDHFFILDIAEILYTSSVYFRHDQAWPMLIKYDSINL